jgi:EAL domain-containing protein (putative c-di-GMP-specific phosphodiesterase class I)/GGDEF domain-containing protein
LDDIKLYQALDKVLNRIKIFCSLHDSKRFYIGVLSVENFSIIEQNFGELMSDLLDKTISEAFEQYSREEYFLNKISYNSYAFIVINTNNKLVLVLLENILNYINQRKHFSTTQNVYFLVRTGLAEHTNDEDIQKTFNKAQVSLFECSNEKKRYSFYKKSLDTIQKHVNNTDLLANYLEALESNKLVFDFQPIVDSRTRQTVFYECLLRLVDEKGYRLSGYSHIQAAEQYGMISNIDQFTLITAVKTLEKDPNLKLHINISGITITDSDWMELAQQLFYKKDFYHRLTIEITETAIIKNLKAANFFMKLLRELGCKISIDDFGSGYSSFSQLKNIRVDSIKIGEDYIKDLPDKKDTVMFLQTLVEYAKNLNLDIIAEHVEKESTAKFLADSRVDYLQGYLFS